LLAREHLPYAAGNGPVGQSGSAALMNGYRVGYAASWEMAVSSVSFEERGGAASGQRASVCALPKNR
jgi:hypothetical protein